MTSHKISVMARRLHRALPPVLLGALFNVLDAGTLRLLCFTTAEPLNTYIFPGALSGMLVEILPFLQSIASDIRDVLGDDSSAFMPMVLFTYALTTFIIGILSSTLAPLYVTSFS